MRGIIKENIKRIVSVIMLLVMLFGTFSTVITPVVYATETANGMGAKMISFFQTGQEDIDLNTISESELRVYGVFLSNFYTQGQTQLKDLSINNTSDEISSKVSQIFFGDTSTSISKINELNNIVYKGISEGLSNNKLVDSSGKALTGKDLLKAMAEKLIVYRQGGTEVIDFGDESFRGAFKVLASSSPKFMVDRENGIPAMAEFYIDPFGNIWGAYNIERKVGDAVDIIKTPITDVHLVLPAALNPIAFYNTSSGSGLQNTKLPLHNSFAMGSLVADRTIKQELTNEVTSYYNIPYFLSDNDRGNALSIYAVNSPFTYVGETNRMFIETITDNTLKEALNDYIGDKRLNYTKNLKIVMGNRLDIMDSTLKDNSNNLFLDKDDNYMTKEQLYSLYDYLYGSLTTTIDNTLSDIYYFGEGGNSTWANNTFDKLGFVGINMFGKEEINEETKKGTGRWHIHSADSQVLSKVASMYLNNDISMNTVNYQEINTAIGNSSGMVESPIKPSIKQKLDVYKNFPFSGRYYIQGVREQNDELLYGLLTVGNLDEDDVQNSTLWGKLGNLLGFNSKAEAEAIRQVIFRSFDGKDEELVKSIYYQTLNTYSVVGAKINAQKEKPPAITINKSEGNVATFEVVNDRVYTANWPGIFWGYMVEMLDMENKVTYDSDNNVVKYDTADFYSTHLPKLPGGLVSGSSGINLSTVGGTSGVANSENKSEEDIKKDLLKRLYGLTSDSPNNYRDTLIKSTLDGFIISTHRAITGSWLADVATVSSDAGSTYSSVVGYVHTPSLYELPFTSWVMSNYMQIYVLAMLFIFVVTLFMVLMNIRTIRQGLLILFIMSFVLLVPNIIVENTINIGNKVTDGIYSDRFDFWALTQHQQSVNRLQGAEVSTSDMDRILASTGEKVQNIYSQDAGVRVKWMAPKKDGTFDQLFNSKYLGNNLATNLTIFKWLFSSFIYEQEFESNDPLATYMYRPYNSIARDAKEYYDYAKENIKQNASIVMVGRLSGTDLDDTQNTEIPTIIETLINKTKDTSNEKKYTDMFVGSAYWYDKSAFTRENDFEIYWSDSQKEDIAERVGQYPNYKDKPESRTVSLWGLGSEIVTDTILEGGSFSRFEKSAGISAVLSSPLSNNSDPHLVGFYKNTESPYYYFYNTLKARYGDGMSFKSSLLDVNVFETREIEALSTTKNTNRLIRDFLDMEGLFTSIIPYMTVANNYVYEWTSINGTEVPDYNFNERDSEVGSTSDLSAEELGVNTDNTELYNSVSNQYMSSKKQREDMEKVWMMYTPWVDQLNSLKSVNQTIKIGSNKVSIDNTLNPSSYLRAGRPMIFSEADMTLKGYGQKDLTDTEQRIQRVLDTTYRDMMYLINYYDLDDEVLLNAAAMYATFNFNREFSQTNIIGESVMLYPQSFEMKNFNYDAFMRMIMLNATGEPIFGTQDLYTRVLEKTSFFTGIMLLLVDILAVIMIPTMKIIILLMLLFLSILLCITTAISPPEKIISVIFKSLIVPTFVFLGSNILFAWLVSLLVGEGMTSYVGSRSVSIVTNDPTVTIGLLIILSIAYVVVMWKTIILLFSSMKAHGMAGIFTGIGVIASAGTMIAKKTAGKTLGVFETTGGAIGGAAVGATMSEKGRRKSGAVSGAMTGAKRQSVYLERSREKRLRSGYSEENKREITGLDEKASRLNNTSRQNTTQNRTQETEQIKEKADRKKVNERQDREDIVDTVSNPQKAKNSKAREEIEKSLDKKKNTVSKKNYTVRKYPSSRE